MPSSLEELLAKDGFGRRRSVSGPLASLSTKTRSMPRFPSRDQWKIDSPSTSRFKTERTKSNIPRYKPPRPVKDGGSDRSWRGGLVREVVNSSGNFSNNEIFEISLEEIKEVEQVYVNDVYNIERRDGYSRGVREKKGYKGREGKGINLVKGHGNSSSKYLLQRAMFCDKHGRSMDLPEIDDDRSSRGSHHGKSSGNERIQKKNHLVPSLSQPALDEVAVKATVSILNGYVKRFLKNKDFRTTLHQNCFLSLNFGEGQDRAADNKFISNLEEAIRLVERAAEGSASAKELKKASVQLSVITGLFSDDLSDMCTSGIPNYRLSACAHLYLSVIFQMQKKDRISAKHLLQVFCDSPSQARMTLLAELWDYLFSPHLSHLKEWYRQEAESLGEAPTRTREIRLLEKVYNELLDCGTHKFAVYYKDWLTEGIEGPSIPQLDIPSVSLAEFCQGDSASHYSELVSPAADFSPQPMVSKKLYNDVFLRSSRPEFDGARDDGEAISFDASDRCSDGSADVKQPLTCSSDAFKHSNQDVEESSSVRTQDDAFLHEDGVSSTAEEEWRTPFQKKDSQEKDKSQEAFNIPQTTLGDGRTTDIPPKSSANEILLKRLAKSASQRQQSENSVDLNISCLPQKNEPLQVRNYFEELHESYSYFAKGSFFSSIPEDYVCPLSGKLIEDPVTLETGQTVDRTAIEEWFDRGNKTCPATGITLQYLSVPVTNFVLKRVIHRWKAENSVHLLDFAYQIVRVSRAGGSTDKDKTATLLLGQLLPAFSREERIMSAQCLISIGGLDFLIRRIDLGDLEEKTCVGELFSYCIEADAGCRNQIARKIKIHNLLELLCSKQAKPKKIAVLLLTQLVCLTRLRDVSKLLSSSQREETLKMMDVLLTYLRSSSPEKKPLISVLLLHLAHLVEPHNCTIYKEEAVDAFTNALASSLIDGEVREKCCRALRILGARSLLFIELLRELRSLNQERYFDVNPPEKEEYQFIFDYTIPLEEHEECTNEECANEELLRNFLSASLIKTGNRSFLGTISNCLVSGNIVLEQACLITVAWLSFSLSSLPDAEVQLSISAILISRLKETLEHSVPFEHKLLASLSLLNFSKIPECRVLLMTMV